MHVHNILASLRKHEEANSGLEKKTLAHWQSIRNKQATEVKLADYLRLPCEIDVALARHIVERGECFFQGEMVTPCEMGERQIKQLEKPSCQHACSPSDFYEGGKCDRMGCYKKQEL